MSNCAGCVKHSELMHLRALVSNYESGKEYTKLQKAYSKQIHELNIDLDSARKTSARNQAKYEDALQDYYSVLEDLNNAMNRLESVDEVLAGKDAEILRLNNIISEQQGVIQKLTAQINRDYTNSSIPSSKSENHKIISNSREKTGRKPGGQPGHSRNTLKKLKPTEPTVYIPAPDYIKEDRNYYLTGKTITRQVIDLALNIKITEYCTPEYRSRKDGTRWHAEFPKGIKGEVNYGPSIKSAAFLLNNYCNVSIDKVSQFISELTGGSIVLSKGFINGLSREFSTATKGKRDELFALLQKAPCLYSDATVGRVNGKNNAVILCATPNEMLYFAKDKKGKDGLNGTPVDDYQFTLVHDHDVTYYNYGSAHQECLAHVLRYLQNSIENEPKLTWNAEMKNLISAIIHEHKKNLGKFTNDRKAQLSKLYDDIVALGEKEYRENPPSKYYTEGRNLLKRLHEYKDSHLYFMYHEGVGYTNNLSERSLRAYKRKQKQAVSFRSKSSQEYFCDSLSILKTAQLRNENIFVTAKNAFAYTRE